MTVREIVAEWLKAHGYDGLYDDDCGCRVDDLMLCESPAPNCQPGVRKQNDDGDWIIGPAENPHA